MAEYRLSDVLVNGSIIFCPETLGKALKNSCFYIYYDEGSQTAEFSNNDGLGGEVIFTFRDMPYESVAKLAVGMGLTPDQGRSNPRFWHKHVDVIRLSHDGSEEAERIRMEAARLYLECRVVHVEKGPWALYALQRQYTPKMWPIEKIILEMQKWAEQWKTIEKAGAAPTSR